MRFLFYACLAVKHGRDRLNHNLGIGKDGVEVRSSPARCNRDFGEDFSSESLKGAADDKLEEGAVPANFQDFAYLLREVLRKARQIRIEERPAFLSCFIRRSQEP